MQPKKTVRERVGRLEQIVELLAEDQTSTRQLIADLARETRLGFKKVEERFNQVEERFNQVEKRFNQVEKRFNQIADQSNRNERRFTAIDERIDKLVSAMGEFIRRQGKNGKS
jgi:DNA repair ATPase RecN